MTKSHFIKIAKYVRISAQSFVQNSLMKFGIFIRRTEDPDLEFITQFLTAKPCGYNIIKIGDGEDGTYFIPDDLSEIAYCLSPGVGPTSQFEEGLWDRFGIKSFLLDGSVSSPRSDHSIFFDFEKKYLGVVNNEKFTDIDTWLNEKLPRDKECDLIMQMDIEGGEFPTLTSCPEETLRRFRILCVEIHGLDMIMLPFFSQTIEQCFRKLDKFFVVCAARGNDCCGTFSFRNRSLPRTIEITLLRRDRINFGGANLSPRIFEITSRDKDQG